MTILGAGRTGAGPAAFGEAGPRARIRCFGAPPIQDEKSTLSSVITSAPRNADPNPSTWKPGTIHATYNPHKEPLVFLALLSPAKLPEDIASDPDPVDVSTQEPWASIRKGMVECRTLDQS